MNEGTTTEKNKVAKWPNWFWIMIAIAIAAYLWLPADPRNSAVPCDPMEFISWQDLQPGQKGFGLTTFQGNKPTKFYVEFETVAPHPLYQGEKIILVRVGWPLDYSSVLAGMSGSPVYFEQEGKWKLVGALGFGYGMLSSGKALGGITPIQAMLNQEQTLGLAIAAQNPIKKQLSGLKNEGDLLKTLSQPVYLGDYQNSPIYMLQPRFQIVSASSQTTNQTGAAAKITRPQPGEAISALLTDGDCQIGATFTVTHVNGNKFWACGHPFLGEGKIILPVRKTRIATSFQSPLDGFLLPAEFKEYIGFTSYDGVFGIQGEIQELPLETMLPIKLKTVINENDEFKEANFQFQVIKDKVLSELLIDQVTNYLLDNFWNPKNRATTLSVSIIEFSNRKPIYFYNSSAIGEVTHWGPFIIMDDPWSAVHRTTSTISALLDSQWDPKLKGATFEIYLEAGTNVLLLDSCRVFDKNGNTIKEVKPGDRINLVLGLKRLDGAKQFVVRVPLQIPAKLNIQKYPAPLELYIESGNRFKERDLKKLLDHPPDNAEEILNQLTVDQRPPRKIYIQMVFPETNLDKKEPGRAPNMQPAKWLEVKNLEFLRSAKSSERMVIIKELDPPLKDYILDIQTNLRLEVIDKKQSNQKLNKK